MSARTETWTRTDSDGHPQSAYVHVSGDETVAVTYELLSDMLDQLGFTREESAG